MVGLGAHTEWFISKEPPYAKSIAGKSLDTRDCQCPCFPTYITLPCISAVLFWGPPLPQYPHLPPQVSAPIHPSPMFTGIPSSLCFSPCLHSPGSVQDKDTPAPSQHVVQMLGTAEHEQVLHLLSEHGIGLNMSCWFSSGKSESWVQVCCLTGVPLNTGECCFVLFHKKVLVSSQYKLGKSLTSQHFWMAWEMLPTGL